MKNEINFIKTIIYDYSAISIYKVIPLTRVESALLSELIGETLPLNGVLEVMDLSIGSKQLNDEPAYIIINDDILTIYEVKYQDNFKRFHAYGKYYGFPDCCIADMDERNGPAPSKKRKLDGTGYIPCPTCNKLSTDKLLLTINANRVSKGMFPFAKGSNVDFLHYYAFKYETL